MQGEGGVDVLDSVGSAGGRLLNRFLEYIDIEVQRELIHRLDHGQVRHCEVKIRRTLRRLLIEILKGLELLAVYLLKL